MRFVAAAALVTLTAGARLSQSDAPAQTLSQELQTLARIKPAERTRDQSARRCAIQFMLALATGEPEQAAALVDPVGYQPLPSSGPLPEKPAKPVFGAALREMLQLRRSPMLSDLPSAMVRLVRAADAPPELDAARTWMLPDDRLLLLLPPEPPVPGWPSRRAFLVVRVRASRALIVGGDLLAAIAEP
ncbi:MAG: hypothetical protein CHACPFDD_01742 [Phycisphaerae bacterium]|nr:hypothetical protein [Phycisphaerae bacterium]